MRHEGSTGRFSGGHLVVNYWGKIESYKQEVLLSLFLFFSLCLSHFLTELSPAVVATSLNWFSCQLMNQDGYLLHLRANPPSRDSTKPAFASLLLNIAINSLIKAIKDN